MSWPGLAGKERQGLAWLGRERPGRRGEVRTARSGWVGMGTAGEVRQGAVGTGMAWPGRICRAGTACRCVER
jgi:hypothetical protein